jgi:Pin2-interacting protein X1
MLEKMGWKEGKGLGAKEDGTTEHIKVKKKLDNQGIGTETVTHNKNWLETSVAYESILANLNASYGSAKPETAEEKEKPKGVVGRPRKVLYSRMLRAKDLANYSSEDKSAIFGGVPYGVAAAPVEAIKEEAKAQDVGSESEELEEDKATDKKGEEEEDKETDMVSGVTTTTSAVSLQDYFKLKMAEMARKRAGGSDDASTTQAPAVQESVKTSITPKDKKRKRTEEAEEDEEEEETSAKKNKKKDKKKRSKKRKQEEDEGKSKKKDSEKKKKKSKKQKSDKETSKKDKKSTKKSKSKSSA